MSTMTTPDAVTIPEVATAPKEIHLTRRTIDRLLVASGAVMTVALLVAASLLTWGSGFAKDYVGDELTAQNITFGSAESLSGQGRDDLVQYADQQVVNGEQAEAYASYIAGHLEDTADGLTYAEVPDRAARAAVTEAIESGASDAEVAELQATADELTAQRDSLFRGEMLRGALLNAYAWSVVGSIAGYAALGAFIAAAIMAALVIAGLVHLRRMHA
jgi:hypothetical protein